MSNPLEKSLDLIVQMVTSDYSLIIKLIQELIPLLTPKGFLAGSFGHSPIDMTYD